jgi:hypothetical protein
MLKKLKWLIIIPGVLASAAQAQSTAQPTVADVVEKDLFEFHASPEDVAQKVFQSPEYKVNYLTNPSPSDEEKKLLIDSASILSNRAWFLRRMAKNEEPATKYLRDHGFIDKGKTEPSSAQKEKALSAQEGRLKKAVSDYNSLVANLHRAIRSNVESFRQFGFGDWKVRHSIHTDSAFKSARENHAQYSLAASRCGRSVPGKSECSREK